MKTLLLIDWQNNDYQNSDKVLSDVAIKNGEYLLNKWRSKDLNVIHVLTDCAKIYNSNKWRRYRLKTEKPIVDNSVIRQFTPLQEETIIWKPDRSAFFETNLAEILPWGEQIYCTGAATTGCVLATAIHGDALGCEMHFVEDCIFDLDQEKHNNGIQILQKFGRVVNSKDIV